MFSGSDRSAALAVPLFYGIVEAVVLGIYCIWAWKKGWTFAPKDDPFCKVILHSYQIDPHIVKVSGSDQTPDDTTQQSEGEASSSRHAQFISVATTSSAYPVRPYRERLDEEIEVPSWVT